jgi:hypothetical protein
VIPAKRGPHYNTHNGLDCIRSWPNFKLGPGLAHHTDNQPRHRQPTNTQTTDQDTDNRPRHRQPPKTQTTNQRTDNQPTHRQPTNTQTTHTTHHTHNTHGEGISQRGNPNKLMAVLVHKMYLWSDNCFNQALERRQIVGRYVKTTAKGRCRQGGGNG